MVPAGRRYRPVRLPRWISQELGATSRGVVCIGKGDVFFIGVEITPLRIKLMAARCVVLIQLTFFLNTIGSALGIVFLNRLIV